MKYLEIDTLVKEKEPTTRDKKPKGQDKAQAVFKSCKLYHDFNSCFVSNAKKVNINTIAIFKKP